MNGHDVMNTVNRDKVLRLQQAMSTMPQVEPVTRHYFAKGMYGRALCMEKGTVVVGKIHKHEHLFIVTKGLIDVTVDDSLQRLSASDVVCSKPGAKRAILALEESVIMTVHLTDKTDLAQIEEELIEPETIALFDARNRMLK